MCVEIVSLGKVALSNSNTLNPRRARSMAVGEPAHRAPTMIASYIGTSARERIRRSESLAHRQDYPIVAGRTMGNSVYAGQVRLWWNAQAAAPVRLETPTLSKILLTCLATVFSLMNNSSAM